jgi:hypothetical protein
MDATLADTAGMWVAVVLTLFVFSYLLSDNVLFRLAEHLFVGLAIGYAAVVVFHSILSAKLIMPMIEALGQENQGKQLLLLVIPLVLGLLLLTKPSKRFSWLGSISVAFLMGVGSALAIGGALLGTLLPQADATANIVGDGSAFGLLGGLVVLAGTTGVLLHFHFEVGQDGRLAGFRDRLVRTWGGLGRWFILIAFGAILATTFMSRLSLLTGRIAFLLDSVRGLFGG